MLQRIQNLWDDFNTWVAIVATQMEENKYNGVPLLDETPQDIDMDIDDNYYALSDSDDCDYMDLEYRHEEFDNCDDDMIDYDN